MWRSQRSHKWQYSMAHTRCMLDKRSYTRACTCICPRTQARAHTHTRINNTYCFYTATMVSWTRLIVTLYVHCMPCWLLQQIFLRLTARHKWFIELWTAINFLRKTRIFRHRVMSNVNILDEELERMWKEQSYWTTLPDRTVQYRANCQSKQSVSEPRPSRSEFPDMRQS
jgi:hypothetical protein